MAYLSVPRFSRQKGESGFVLLEALVAVAFSATALAIITPMFSKQIEAAKRARDLDQIEAVVNRDINAYRHYARYWRAISKGPYSTAFADPTSPSADLNLLVYNPTPSSCQSWSTTTSNGVIIANAGKLEQDFASDAALYTSKYFPNGVSIILAQGTTGPFKEFSEVQGYKIRRVVDIPLAGSMANVTASSANPSAPRTVRLRYRLVDMNNQAITNMPFERTADVQVEAQFWC